jgi:tRNA modification GTPase
MDINNPDTDAATIFAPATAVGRSGIAVIRLSGPAVRAALTAFDVVVPPPRQARRAVFHVKKSGEVIDNGLVLFFPGPRSYTGEDVAELHVHGSRAVITAMLEVLGGVPGLRLAEPGEFTRRAFLNGKLDLAAAEGVADLVAAETAAQRRQALRQLGGALGRLAESWRHRLLHSLARIEAAIDFPEEGLPAELETEVRRETKVLAVEIERHLADAHRGEILRDGLSVAIVGPPNVGKSSLLNALARREAAIVSATAGTTRDIIELHLDLGGWPLVLADTAGIRETHDEIEAEGVRRARSRAEAADLRLVVIDACAAAAQLRTMGALAGSGAVVIANKTDLGSEALPEGILPLSVATGAGLPALVTRLRQEAEDRLAGGGAAPVVTRARHRAALEEAALSLRRAAVAGEIELMAEDLRLAARALGRIAGRVDVEDLLDVIFREFCIGK